MKKDFFGSIGAVDKAKRVAESANNPVFKGQVVVVGLLAISVVATATAIVVIVAAAAMRGSAVVLRVATATALS